MNAEMIDWEEGRDQFATMHETVSNDGRSRGPSIDLDPTWDEITKLRWLAALIESKTGIRIYVHHGRGTINGRRLRNHYSLNIGHHSLSSMPYDSCWTILNGVEIGAEEAKP